jgi:hypothetical protein
MTPKLEARAIATARFIDQLKLVNKELEREAGFQKLILDKRQGDINEGLSLLEQTPSGQRDKLARQAENVASVARANPNDEVIQRRALEALANLRKQMDDLNKPVDGVRSEFDKLADTIEKTMDRSTDAVLDFVVDGKGGCGNLFSAFRRDLLRQVIEDPLRDSMKSAVSIIRKELAALTDGGGGNLFGGILSFIRGLFGSSSGGGGGNGFGIGFTGAANGGPVRAGQLIRWQENGREWFVPGSDGTVVNPGQQKAMMGGSQNVFAPVLHVNGDVGPGTVALVQAMLAKQQAAWMRSMRTGGAMAVA